WGFSFLFMRVIVPVFRPVPTACFRLFLGGALIWALVHFKGGAIGWRRKWRYYLGYGFVNQALPFALFAVASLRAPASFLAVLNATTPLWGTFFSWLILRER